MQETVTMLEALKNPSTRRETFPLLVKEYQERVYRIVRKMLISHDDTDDVVQEVFVKIWNNLDGFKGESGLFTWIYRIATNECLQFLRKRKSRFWSGQSVSEELAEKLEAETFVDGDELQLKLQKAILSLPDRQRLVFNLRYYEELSYEQIATITGTTEGNLKAAYHHATKKIEEFLKCD